MLKKYAPAIIIVLIIAITTLLIFYFVREKSNTELIYCGPDKTNPVRVFINPEQAFPAFATGYQVKLNAGVALLDTLSKAVPPNGSAGSEIRTEIVELREKLNQDNIRMENLMRASFYAYNGRPCDAEVSRRYLNMLDTLAYKITELEKLKAAVTTPALVTIDTSSHTPADTAARIVTSKEITNDTLKLKRAIKIFNERVNKNFVSGRNNTVIE